MEFSPCLMDNSNYNDKWPFSIAFCKRLPEANSTDWVQDHPKSWGSASRYIFPKGVPIGPRFWNQQDSAPRLPLEMNPASSETGRQSGV